MRIETVSIRGFKWVRGKKSSTGNHQDVVSGGTVKWRLTNVNKAFGNDFMQKHKFQIIIINMTTQMENEIKSMCLCLFSLACEYSKYWVN